MKDLLYNGDGTYNIVEWNYNLDGGWKLGEKPFLYKISDVWDYKLDGTWQLGAKPFATLRPDVTVKTPVINSKIYTLVDGDKYYKLIEKVK